MERRSFELLTSADAMWAIHESAVGTQCATSRAAWLIEEWFRSGDNGGEGREAEVRRRRDAGHVGGKELEFEHRSRPAKGQRHVVSSPLPTDIRVRDAIRECGLQLRKIGCVACVTRFRGLHAYRALSGAVERGKKRAAPRGNGGRSGHKRAV